MDKDKAKRKIIYPIAVYLLVIVLPAVVASILCYFFPEGLVHIGGGGIDSYFIGLLLFPLILIPYGWKTQDKRTSALGSIVGWIGYSPLYSLFFNIYP
jgi:phosphotransferase system  glucose/maltose/N-acetylglucosamine-specific IIC component